MNNTCCFDKLCLIVLVGSLFIIILLCTFIYKSIVQIYYLRYLNIEMINAPDIKPIKVKEFETKQSKYSHWKITNPFSDIRT